MIVVKVELWSAVTGAKTELARMHISNDGTGTATRRSYDGTTFRGRSTRDLDRLTVSKSGRITDLPSQQLHIWNLVARMLTAMGYTR